MPIPLTMQSQPDDRSCGPTCLQAVYRYFGHDMPLSEVIDGIPQLETGGTLAVQLGCHALRRGFAATIYTYNLQLFDPTWFLGGGVDLRARLREQVHSKPDDGRLGSATAQYLDFLDQGGVVCHEPLEPDLILRFLGQGLPILTGLSATYLYSMPRETPDDRPDDVGGQPVGHFVVLVGYDPERGEVTLEDPWPDGGTTGQRRVKPLFSVLSAILLGVLTYDANLLVIRPR